MGRIDQYPSNLLTQPDPWIAYTPTLVQPGAVTKTVSRASYMRFGRLIVVQIRLAVTGTGTVANDVSVGLPILATATGPAGHGWIFDASTSTRYVGTWNLGSTSAVNFISDVSAGNGWGTTPSIALASGDAIDLLLTYEAAS